MLEAFIDAQILGLAGQDATEDYDVCLLSLSLSYSRLTSVAACASSRHVGRTPFRQGQIGNN